jgi:hypothetical protein
MELLGTDRVPLSQANESWTQNARRPKMAECITDKDSSYCYMTEEELKEAKMNRVARLTVVAAAAALLFSFVAISNLNYDINKTLNNKVAYVEHRVSDVAPEFKEKVRVENTY